MSKHERILSSNSPDSTATPQITGPSGPRHAGHAGRGGHGSHGGHGDGSDSGHDPPSICLGDTELQELPPEESLTDGMAMSFLDETDSAFYGRITP